jgi:hypothetical protein
MAEVIATTWLIWAGREVPPGERMDVPDETAESLIRRGKAEPVQTKAEPKAEPVKAAEPKPARKPRAKKPDPEEG